jgi:hypothetical protein
VADRLPRLKITGLGWESGEETWDFEQARYFPYREWLLVTVEGRVVKSYEDVLALASEDRYRGKEYLNVIFLPIMVGG